ncbi:IS2 transposase TnpB [Sphingomonas jeddahensis]|uniref:IS2 transposase TnpB n=1 Tax=Sphingomonas jeddahensis TaxID=1915074 RepID=A0A1V2ERL7_9SPHN|nr:IS2 transposase TnpB [Sphingomonas jeddahensis]
MHITARSSPAGGHQPGTSGSESATSCRRLWRHVSAECALSRQPKRCPTPALPGESRILVGKLRFKPFFTSDRSPQSAIRNPQSNSIFEAVANTLIRDYVGVTPLAGGVTASTSLPGWVGDHNDNHPHSALRLRLPCEYRWLVSVAFGKRPAEGGQHHDHCGVWVGARGEPPGEQLREQIDVLTSSLSLCPESASDVREAQKRRRGLSRAVLTHGMVGCGDRI